MDFTSFVYTMAWPLSEKQATLHLEWLLLRFRKYQGLALRAKRMDEGRGFYVSFNILSLIVSSDRSLNWEGIHFPSRLVPRGHPLAEGP